MAQFAIERTRQFVDTEGIECEYTKVVKRYDSLQEAMDDLYRFAHRRGYEVTIDNTLDGSFGFCLWQIQVKVGEWVYKPIELVDQDGLDEFGFPI